MADETPTHYAVHISGLETSVIFIVEAEDFIGAVMKGAEYVGKLNTAMKQKFPDTGENEFTIYSVHRSELVLFSEEWLAKYVGDFVAYTEDD